jgi:hypothetical protein
LKEYFHNFFVALSQLVNTIIGGYPDESLSARAWRTSKNGAKAGIAFRYTIDALFYTFTLGKDKHHCLNSYESEILRKHLPKQYK